jgi:PhoU domain
MTGLTITNHRFPWSFRPVSRPFSGRLKVLELLLAQVCVRLMALAEGVHEIERWESEVDLPRIQLAEREVGEAVTRLDAQCLRILAQPDLRPSQRLMVAYLLRGTVAVQEATDGFHELYKRLTVVHDQYSRTALLQSRDLGNEVLRMLGRSLEAFRNLDPALARAARDQETWIIYLTRNFQSRATQAILMDEVNLDWVTECHSVVHHWEGIVGSALNIAREVLRLQAPPPPAISTSIVIQ